MSFNQKNKSIVSIIMCSKSDWVTLKKSAEILKKLKINGVNYLLLNLMLLDASYKRYSEEILLSKSSAL